MLNHNKLTEIPQFVAKMKALVKLECDNNKIIEMPAFLVESDMRQLSLAYNLITVVPEFIEKMKLKPGLLYLEGNPITRV